MWLAWCDCSVVCGLLCVIVAWCKFSIVRVVTQHSLAAWIVVCDISICYYIYIHGELVCAVIVLWCVACGMCGVIIAWYVAFLV